MYEHINVPYLSNKVLVEVDSFSTLWTLSSYYSYSPHHYRERFILTGNREVYVTWRNSSQHFPSNVHTLLLKLISESSINLSLYRSSCHIIDVYANAVVIHTCVAVTGTTCVSENGRGLKMDLSLLRIFISKNSERLALVMREK